MPTFGAYNTSDTTTGNTPLAANGIITLGPLQTDRAQRIVGVVFADQAGTLKVQQSFDGGLNWDVSQTFTVAAGVAQQFSVEIIAPIAQLVYTNGATAQGVMRLFTRVFTSGY